MASFLLLVTIVMILSGEMPDIPGYQWILLAVCLCAIAWVDRE